VKYHIKNLLQKTGCRSTLQLVVDVVDKKLILPNTEAAQKSRIPPVFSPEGRGNFFAVFSSSYPIGWGGNPGAVLQ
jgi:hypothetical protein